MDVAANTFVITGAARGLGLAIAHSLAAQNANVMLADRDEDALQEALSSMPANTGKQSSLVANVTDEADVEALFDKAEAELGPVSGLVNNAGILRDGMLVKVKEGEVVDRMSLATWQSVIDVNLTGVFLCGREAAERMIVSGQSGVIINISSISRAGNAGQSNYAAAKAGVVALSTTWAKELARYGIRSASIAPGVFETEMVASMKPEAKARFVGMIPAKRTGAVEELADAVNFIIKNDYYTGRVMELDGGLRV
ncbi:MAG: SDR family NAD(P)-dependent oxidoreductase [Leucothrix sp.]